MSKPFRNLSNDKKTPGKNSYSSGCKFKTVTISIDFGGISLKEGENKY